MTTVRAVGRDKWHSTLVLVALLHCLVPVGALYAQYLPFTHYTVDDGLPTNAVYGGLQSRNGYIWFCTEKGVSRFDGYTFRNFTVADGLSLNDVWDLREDRHGRIWLSSFSGKLTVIDGEEVYHLFEAKSPAFSGLQVFQTGEKVWAVAEGLNFLLKPQGEGSPLDTVPFDASRLSRSQKGEPLDIPLFLSPDSLMRIQSGPPRVTIESLASGESNSYTLPGFTAEVAEEMAALEGMVAKSWAGGGMIRYGGGSTLYFFDIKGWKLKRIDLTSYLDRIPDLVRFQELGPNFLIQTNLGMLVLSPGGTVLDVINLDESQLCNIHRTFSDREGNIWVCTKENGVAFLTAQQRNSQLMPSDVRQDVGVMHLAQGKEGQLYAGTRNGRVYALKGNRLEGMIAPGKRALNDNQEVRALRVAPWGELWLARSTMGVERFRLSGGKVQKHWLSQEGAEVFGGQGLHDLPGTDSTVIVGNKDFAFHAKNNWVAIARGGISMVGVLDENHKVKSWQRVSEKRAYSSAFDAEGRLWLGHLDGLSRYSPAGGGAWNEDASLLPGEYILDVQVDEQGRVWAGTDGFGLMVWDGHRLSQVKGTEGMRVQGMAIGGHRLWLATNEGVIQVVIGEPVAGSRVEVAFTRANGLPSIEVNAVAVDSTYLYAGTSKGLARLLRRPVYFNFRPPLLTVAPPSGLNVEPQLAHCEAGLFCFRAPPPELIFRFTGLSFKSQQKIKYYYQLEGVDAEVRQAATREARYTDVPPGDYRFTVLAEDVEGLRSEVAEVRVRISSNFYEQALPWLLLILALGFGGIALHKLRMHRMRQANAREAALSKQFAELELRALQAQMNPHFVFNAFSAIQYFIQINDREQADRYLSKFALLMRQFLESSKSRYLSLEQEARLIRLYVELEQLRFPGQLAFDFQLHPSINAGTTLIPAMLLQPFVENAINHGLFHKKSGGKLTIVVRPGVQDGLQCIIEDNGVGRKAAALMQQRAGRSHRSRAMRMTSERLNAIRVIEGYDVKVETEDLYGPHGEAVGTKVVIEVPEID
ncbi:hypothetical protein FRY97_02585 [Phaeodactylibacter luteus]|uniref:Signal transduction histidine kinase internal region domain-containing protein n=1 Tax=Phaeodactylibacter luteus TaxID=1564516 RepID=A0A5C6S0D0_9BACT|nr:hypothetical protein FRY97_02585 [Phaeodactylibacter luteus]